MKEAVVNEVKLIPDLPVDDVLHEIRRLGREGDISQRAIGYYLRDLTRRNAFPPGFISAAHWAARKLGRDVKTLRRMERVAEPAHGRFATLSSLPRARRRLLTGTARRITGDRIAEIGDTWPS